MYLLRVFLRYHERTSANAEPNMAFRADEASRIGYEQAEAYLIPRARDAGEVQRARGKEALADIVSELGPVVAAYPTWHPLVWHHDNRHPITYPDSRCGYQGIDHTVLLAKGFITCPYGDGQQVIDSVAELPLNPAASIKAERLDVQLYSPDATPVLIKCEWEWLRGTQSDEHGMIPVSTVIPLMLEKELPCWRWAEVAETWETMRPYFLGRPHGSRSSLFVSQETGQAIKNIWNALISTGMFGPIKV